MQAGLKARDQALREVVLTDVCPYSLGVEVADRLPNGAVRSGLFEPVIERNTTIPASRVKTFSTMSDGQPLVDVRIYQGESRLVSDNVALGELRVPVPPRPAGQIGVECRFTYDIDGLLEVDLHVPETGERRSAVIADDETIQAQDFAKRRARLAALKVHPRETDANRAALARGARLYEEALGEVRQHVAALVSQFEGALESQDPKLIAVARGEFLDHLDQLEGRTFL